MKQKLVAEDQIIGPPKAKEGAVMAEIWRGHGPSSAIYYALNGKYGGFEVPN